MTTGELSDKLTNRKESVIDLCLYICISFCWSLKIFFK